MGSILSHSPSIKWDAITNLKKEDLVDTLTDKKTISIAAGTFLATWAALKIYQKITGPKLPPGPPSIPIIGNVREFWKRPNAIHLTFKELADKYGEVVMLTIFGETWVILNTLETAKEAFIKNADITSDRHLNYLIGKMSFGGKGIMWHVNTWRESRLFALTALRDLGFGKSSMENKIIEEGEALVKEFSETKGEVFSPASMLHDAVANVIISLCFGSRMDYKDERFRTVVGIIDENMKLSTRVGIRMLLIEKFPPARIFPWPGYMIKADKNLEKITQFFEDQIAEHKLTYDADNIRDMVDMLIQKEMEGNEDHPIYCVDNVNAVIRDLLFAGTDTTATALHWSFLYLINYPHVQEKMHKELDQVVGSGRLPTLADRSNMNYFHATLLEILRMSNIGPMTFPHRVTKEFKIGEYTIPKEATLMANLYCIHMSERYWDDPATFNPERFLDDKGQMINKEGFVAFGFGPCACIGEGLARSEFFLLMASILQKFTLKGEDDTSKPSLEGKLALTLAPMYPVKMRAIPR